MPMVARDEIQIRDPFILPVEGEEMYYMYGTTDPNCWGERGTGFDVYRSADLEHWEGPFEAFRPNVDFWADRHYWAPEGMSIKARMSCSPALSRRIGAEARRH
jgi:arabinan endo-1,5-alpha-L-arabinosidase